MSEDQTHPSKYKIIFIDDEENILNSFKRIFRKENYEVYTTTDPKQVFSWVQEMSVALVVSDQRMPIMEGVEVLTEVKKISPDSIRVMLTGYADMDSAIRAVNSGNIFRFLSKPWVDEDLKTSIASAVAQYRLIQENKELQALTKKQNQQLIESNLFLEKRVQERTVEVTQLNKKLEKSLLESIKLMGELAEYSGSLPEGHSKRVARIAGEIAKELNCTSSDCLDVQVAAYLHDVGKIARNTEYSKHPVKGAEISRLIPGWEKVADLILHHHEKMDGTGFPSKLKGEQIPLGSRIINVADAWDKLLHLSDPSNSLSPIRALADLKSRDQTEFDPKVVIALESAVKRLGILEKDLKEVEIGLFELKPGMMLSRPIRAQDGRVLLAADYLIEKSMLERLLKAHLETPIHNEIFIYIKPSEIKKVS